MVKIFLDSVGCRLNQSEIETMARQLLASGHEIVADPAKADKVIVNTCAVTREAARDSRSRARRFHRLSPGANIILTGCYATLTPTELEKIEGVEHVVANKDKNQVVQLVDPAVSAALPLYDQEPILREYLSSQSGRTRAFVKVQDGCDNNCTFCITTIARGDARSRRMGDILAEIRGLESAGYQEAVLTGVHLGSYGEDIDDSIRLDTLIQSILDRTNIPRLRISSLEPWNIPEGFFDLWSNPRLLPHLHIPLQSGSDRVLRRMSRRTNRAKFRNLIQSARQKIPNLAVSTDLIAGFPGETDEDFEDTCGFVSEMMFSRLHVFTFSGRPGTAAHGMSDQIPIRVRKKRARRLIELGSDLSLDFYRQNDGRMLPVLWEQFDGRVEGGSWVGYSDNYIRVRAASACDLTNKVTKTIVSKPTPSGMTGEVILTDCD